VGVRLGGEAVELAGEALFVSGVLAVAETYLHVVRAELGRRLEQHLPHLVGGAAPVSPRPPVLQVFHLDVTRPVLVEQLCQCRIADGVADDHQVGGGDPEPPVPRLRDRRDSLLHGEGTDVAVAAGNQVTG
jgi:hypothetical protein